MERNETIAALSTGRGGAIAVIRMSGPEAVAIAEKIFVPLKGGSVAGEKGFTLRYGWIADEKGERIDDVLLSLFRAPHSYTGEDMIEVSCHASPYIEQALLHRMLSCGARPADAGEFTLRAFVNGKLDLVQAEGVADLIASNSAASHRLAVNQMRGGYSAEFARLREKLLKLLSLLELELDFGEEEVEFADRSELKALLREIREKIESLAVSFRSGNVLKNGVPVAIVGAPNAGKSTLLNLLLGEERAMVSDIPGTTRDVIEETLDIDGTLYRFIDTAGIRHTTDTLEEMGITRTFDRIAKARLVLFVFDGREGMDILRKQLGEISLQEWQDMVVVLNKSDLEPSLSSADVIRETGLEAVPLSAKTGRGADELKRSIASRCGASLSDGSVVITNARHYDLLTRSLEGIERGLNGLEAELSSDLVAQDIRESLYYLGAITGEVTSDDVLHNIFANFCIGK